MRILYHDARTTIGIPAIGVLGDVAARATAGDVDGGEDDGGGVGDEEVVLGRVAEEEVADFGVLEAGDAEEDGAEGVDVFGVEIVPELWLMFRYGYVLL